MILPELQRKNIEGVVSHYSSAGTGTIKSKSVSRWVSGEGVR